jgi:hypothetical protein
MPPAPMSTLAIVPCLEPVVWEAEVWARPQTDQKGRGRDGWERGKRKEEGEGEGGPGRASRRSDGRARAAGQKEPSRPSEARRVSPPMCCLLTASWGPVSRRPSPVPHSLFRTISDHMSHLKMVGSQSGEEEGSHEAKRPKRGPPPSPRRGPRGEPGPARGAPVHV